MSPDQGTVAIGSSHNLIGTDPKLNGTDPGARNVISTSGSGIGIDGTNNVIRGNYIGTDATGTQALGNGIGVGLSEAFNTVGGTDPGARNLISGHGVDGIQISGTNNVIQGNYIGTDATGTKAMGNGFSYFLGAGIELRDGASNNTIGGTATGARNVISGNYYGILVARSRFVSGTVIEGNFIGTDRTGTTTTGLGNQATGVAFSFGALGNTVGGTTPGAGNVIAGSGLDGVSVRGSGNAILSNSIHDNGGLGMRLDLANDPNANHNQAVPALQLAVCAGGVTVLNGTLHSVASTTFTLQFFSNVAPDPSGYGEGQTLLGNYTVTTDLNGYAKFVAVLSAGVPLGQGSLSATATNQSTNDTSQFAQDLINVAPNTAGLYIGINPSLLQQLLALLPTLQKDGDLNLDAGHLEAIIAQLLGL